MSNNPIDLISYAKKEMSFLKDDKGNVPILDPIDSRAVDTLTDLTQAEIIWNPYQTEILLDEAKRTLSNCFDLRATGQNLEQQATMEVINHHYLKHEIELLNTEIELYSSEHSVKLINNQISLKKTGTNKYSSIIGTDKSIEASTEFEKKFYELNKSKIELKKQANDLVYRQRDIEGSALNLKCRFEKIKELYDIKLRELFRILQSLEKGLKFVFPSSHKIFEDLSFPAPSNTAYLNTVYKYLNSLGILIDQIKQTEQNLTFHLRLKSGIILNGKNYPFVGDVSKFDSELTAGNLTVTLPEEFFERYDNIRLQGMEISFYNQTRLKDSSTDHIPIYVKPPIEEQTPGGEIWESPDYLTNAFYYSGKSLDDGFFSDSLLTNRPLKGTWTISPEKGADYTQTGYDLVLTIYATGTVKFQ